MRNVELFHSNSTNEKIYSHETSTSTTSELFLEFFLSWFHVSRVRWHTRVANILCSKSSKKKREKRISLWNSILSSFRRRAAVCAVCFDSRQGCLKSMQMWQIQKQKHHKDIWELKPFDAHPLSLSRSLFNEETANMEMEISDMSQKRLIHRREKGERKIENAEKISSPEEAKAANG